MKTEETSRVSSDKPLLTVAYLETLPDDDNNRYELIAGELFVFVLPVYLTNWYCKGYNSPSESIWS